MLECNCPRWALLFTEAPKELPDRNIHLVVIEMATMSVKHILKVLFIVSKAKMVVGRESWFRISTKNTKMKLDVDRQAYEPRIAVYGAALHQQEPDVAVAVGKDGYLKVSLAWDFAWSWGRRCNWWYVLLFSGEYWPITGQGECMNLWTDLWVIDSWQREKIV